MQYDKSSHMGLVLISKAISYWISDNPNAIVKKATELFLLLVSLKSTDTIIRKYGAENCKFLLFMQVINFTKSIATINNN